MARNPHYFSQLAHIEVLTTDLEKSVHFFADVVGMDIGGLLGRWYAQYGPTQTAPATAAKNLWVNRTIDKLVMVGTPHHGSDAAKVFPAVVRTIIDVVCGGLAARGATA